MKKIVLFATLLIGLTSAIVMGTPYSIAPKFPPNNCGFGTTWCTCNDGCNCQYLSDKNWCNRLTGDERELCADEALYRSSQCHGGCDVYPQPSQPCPSTVAMRTDGPMSLPATMPRISPMSWVPTVCGDREI